MIVPAVMVSPDVVILPAASVQAASADQQAGSGLGAQIQRTESGKAIAKGPTGARAFKRVNDDEWLGKKGAWDNSYEAKFGSSGWGAKASQTLLQVCHTWNSNCIRLCLHHQSTHCLKVGWLVHQLTCTLSLHSTLNESLPRRRSEAKTSGMRKPRRKGAPIKAA